MGSREDIDSKQQKMKLKDRTQDDRQEHTKRTKRQGESMDDEDKENETLYFAGLLLRDCAKGKSFMEIRAISKT